MSVTIKIDKTPWKKIKANLLKANQEALKVGFFSDAQYGPENENLQVAQVAQWMEEGDPVLYPARPFFRMGFIPRLGTQEYTTVFKETITSILTGKSTLKNAYTRLGPVMKAGLQNEIVAWSTPPNSPQTVENKGFNDPLIDSGKMLESVDFKVEREGV